MPGTPPPPAVEEAGPHPLPVLLARHGWSEHHLHHALGVNEHAAAEIVAHARRIAAAHGHHGP
jgi:hypothetical protein